MSNTPNHVSEQSEIRAAWRTVKRVSPFMWPVGNFDLRARVVLALLALVATKFVAILSPILQAWAVDDLAGSGVPEFALGAIGLTVAYGMARIATNGFQQIRDALFAKVAQSALRRLALETFEHIHRLSMRYHITRKTGGLSRIIERGVKGVEFLLRYLVFSTGPLVLELVLIGAAIFWKLQDWRYVGIILATIAVYVWFTFAITEWRVKLRRKMNEQDTPENIVHGYVAQDVSESAAKEGAEVTLTSLFKKEEMTAAEQEVNDAMHEGVNILNGVMPVKIEKNDENRAVAMIVADCTFDENNIPVPVEGTERRIEADLIVAAIGQAPDIEGIDELGNERGFFEVDDYYRHKTKEGHFVAGDIIRPHLLTTAIGQGSIVSQTIKSYFENKDFKITRSIPSKTLNEHSNGCEDIDRRSFIRDSIFTTSLIGLGEKAKARAER